MIVVVPMVVMVVRLIVMVMIATVLVGVYRELGRGHTRAQDAIGVHVNTRERQAPERLLQRLEREPGVEERAERHIARDAREAIEVQHLHQWPDSLKLQYFVSPRIT